MNIVDYCNKVGVSVEDVNGRSRKAKIVTARHVWWHHLYSVYNMGYSEIGRRCGVDHSTVYNAIKRVRNMIDTKDKLGRHCIEVIIGGVAENQIILSLEELFGEKSTKTQKKYYVQKL